MKQILASIKNIISILLSQKKNFILSVQNYWGFPYTYDTSENIINEEV